MVVLSALTCFSATAKDYVLINPNTPGSSAEITARALAEAYKKRTGNTLIIQNVGGGNQVPGVVHFKQFNSPAILINTTGILIFNPKMMQNLPYSDADFDHVSAVALAPAVWVVRADRPYASIQDLLKKLPNSTKPFVGYANNFELANFRMVAQRQNWPADRVTTVKYKGPPEVVLGLLSNDIDVAMVALTPALVEQVRAGKLKILANTTKQELQVADQRVPSMESLTGIEQFSGGQFLSLSPRFDPAEAQQLRKDLAESLKDPVVQESLTGRNQVIMEHGPRAMTEFVNNYRKKIAPLDLGSN